MSSRSPDRRVHCQPGTVDQGAFRCPSVTDPHRRPLLDRPVHLRPRQEPGLLRRALRLDLRGGRRGVRRLHQLLEGRRAASPAAWRNDGSAGHARRLVGVPGGRRRRRDGRRGRGQRRPGRSCRRWTSATSARMAVVTDAGGAAIGMWQPGEHKGFGVARRARRAGLVRAPHPRLRRLGRASTGRSSAGTPTSRATPPSSATRRSARARRQRPGSWTPAASCPRACPPTGRSTSRWTTPTPPWRRIGELGGAVVLPAEDTPYGRLAQAADPTGALFKLVAG